MTTGKNGFNLKGILEKIVYALIIGLTYFVIDVKVEVSNITDNKASIGKLWQKYGEMNKQINCNNNTKAIDRILNEMAELRRRHMQ